MRRSGCSSCLLRPKTTMASHNFDSSDEEEKQNHVEQPPAPNVTLSVTLLSTEQLPSYSAERFFLLSELEVKAQLKFLCDCNDDDDEELTRDTEEDSLSTSSSDCQESSGPVEERPLAKDDQFPEFVLLYFLWRPSESNSPQAFVETTMVEAVQRLQALVNVVPSSTKTTKITPSETTTTTTPTTDADVSSSSTPKSIEPLPSPTSVIAPEHDFTETAASDSRRQAVSIYLVVDRVAPPPSEEATTQSPGGEEGKIATTAGEGYHQEQQNLANQLARQVAGHALLRSVCEGVTVGVSNHVRAAPGLEACVDAVNLVASNRLPTGGENSSSSKSLLGLVALRPGDCLGLQSEHVTDAAQGVLQNRICAEWNGMGNLQSYARRANAAFRLQNGLPPELNLTEHARRRVPRIQKPPQYEDLSEELDEVDMAEELEERIVVALVGLFLGLFVSFHFMDDIRGIVRGLIWLFQGNYLETLAETLREL